MNVPNVITPEINTPQQTTSEMPQGVEHTPAAEVATTSPDPTTTQVNSDDDDGSSTILIPQDPSEEVKIPDREVADLVGSGVERADDDWVGQVRKLIKEDEGQPFKEEEDTEKLNEDYMKSRFNIDVDAPTEEK